jgi:hypothetical protein
MAVVIVVSPVPTRDSSGGELFEISLSPACVGRE